jgi:hypothetical protein
MRAERISELDIPPGYEQLPLHLTPEMADIPVFRKFNQDALWVADLARPVIAIHNYPKVGEAGQRTH